MNFYKVKSKEVFKYAFHIERLQTVKLQRGIAKLLNALGNEVDELLIIVPHKDHVGLNISIVLDGKQVIPVSTQHVFYDVQKAARFLVVTAIPLCNA